MTVPRGAVTFRVGVGPEATFSATKVTGVTFPEAKVTGGDRPWAVWVTGVTVAVGVGDRGDRPRASAVTCAWMGSIR